MPQDPREGVGHLVGWPTLACVEPEDGVPALTHAMAGSVSRPASG